MEAGKFTAENNNGGSFHADESVEEGNQNTNATNGFQRSEGLMPLNVVSRIMRSALPPRAKVSEEAKLAVQSCLSEYISFVTSEANDRCHREMRKTIIAEDILYALSKLGFDSYVEPLSLYLNRYRQFEAQRNVVRGEPSVRRTVSYPSPGVQQYPSPPPPPPPVYYCLPPPTTQFAPLHGYNVDPTPIDSYYRVPQPPADNAGDLLFNPLHAQPGGNAFPDGLGGTAFNAVMNALNAQAASPGCGQGPESTVAGLHAGGSRGCRHGGATAARNIRFNAPGTSRGNGRRRRV